MRRFVLSLFLAWLTVSALQLGETSTFTGSMRHGRDGGSGAHFTEASLIHRSCVKFGRWRSWPGVYFEPHWRQASSTMGTGSAPTQAMTTVTESCIDIIGPESRRDDVYGDELYVIEGTLWIARSPSARRH